MDYNVVINRKNIKNMYLRIDNNGDIIVSANKRIKEKDIHDFVKSKEKWINKKREKILNIEKVENLNNKIISILGVKYKIKIIKGNIENIDIVNDTLLFISDDISRDNVIKKLNEFLHIVYKNVLKENIVPYCEAIAKKEKINTQYNLKVKLLKSRYGSYSAKTNTICLNLCLVKYDKDVICSVLLHELAHKKYMNHKKEFYSMLYKMCPDYEKCSKKLKSDFVYSDLWFLTK